MFWLWASILVDREKRALGLRCPQVLSVREHVIVSSLARGHCQTILSHYNMGKGDLRILYEATVPISGVAFLG